MSRKVKTGVVVSDKMDKSIVVEVTRTKKHQLYKKYVRIRTKFKAHDEEQKARPGDFVRIEECRPLSKTKCWRLVSIIREAPGRGISQ